MYLHHCSDIASVRFMMAIVARILVTPQKGSGPTRDSEAPCLFSSSAFLLPLLPSFPGIQASVILFVSSSFFQNMLVSMGSKNSDGCLAVWVGCVSFVANCSPYFLRTVHDDLYLRLKDCGETAHRYQYVRSHFLILGSCPYYLYGFWNVCMPYNLCVHGWSCYPFSSFWYRSVEVLIKTIYRSGIVWRLIQDIVFLDSPSTISTIRARTL